MNYTCKRCNFGCIQKNDMRRHLTRKNPCKALCLDISRDTLIEELEGNIKNESCLNPKLNPFESKLNPFESNLIKTEHKEDSNKENKHKCIYCEKIYSTNSNMCKHLKTCKEKIKKEKLKEEETDLMKQMMAQKDEENQLYKEEMALMRKQIELLMTKIGNTNIETQNNTNIETQNNTTNIQINGWGHEDTSHLTDKFLRFCYDRPFTSIQRVIEAVYFNPNCPKNWNTMIKDDKSSKALIYDAEKDAWIKKETIGVLDDLMYKGYSILDENFDKQRDANKLTDRIIEKFTDFQDFYAKGDKHYEKRLATEIKELLINYRAYHTSPNKYLKIKNT